MTKCLFVFVIFSVLLFCFFVSHHIFVLCDQNSDLAGNMSFHEKKIICDPALQESPCNDYLSGWFYFTVGVYSWVLVSFFSINVRRKN